MNTDFEKAFKELGFYKSIIHGFDYFKNVEYVTYRIKYEGYAYVLYKDFFIDGDLLDLPIAHFQDADKFKTFFEILTDKFN